MVPAVPDRANVRRHVRQPAAHLDARPQLGFDQPRRLLATSRKELAAVAYAYDIAAQIPVIQGAGGVVSDWNGNAPQLEHQGEFLAASTPQLHASALAVLRGM